MSQPKMPRVPASEKEQRSAFFYGWKVVIALIRTVTVASYALLGYALYDCCTGRQHVGETWFQLLCGYAAVEALFYLFFLRQKARFQKITPLPHRCSSRQERKKLIEQCIAAIRHPDEKLMLRNVREFLEGWFVGSKLEDISFEDFANWCSWAFFNLERKDLLPEDEAELEETIAWYSSQIHWVFPHTSSKERRFCTRLSLDPVQVKHRPFIAYVVTSLMMYSGLLSIRLLGFRKCHRRGVNNNSVDVHYRKGDPAAAKATCKSTLPIVFIHGIGIGFIHYAAFLRTLPTDVDVYLVEWPHVSMKLVFEGPSSISSTVTTLRDIVVGDGHGKTGACFVGHSLGSTAVAWMLHDKSSKSLVKSAVFLDPVNFVLFDPAIAYAFMHRPPNTVMQLLIHYFVSRELFIAHTLSRHFSWSHNALFLEDLKGIKTTVVLSEGDEIVPFQKTKLYFERYNTSEHIKLIGFEGIHHGEMMLRRDNLAVLKRIIAEHCQHQQTHLD
ncbi:hypothetical protein DIPPA_26738 [Diplonema papillatum]|nr:hypothetical protein DIPPA_26738 [Diplonema papillatum]